ncbi:hypothetical protein PITCH_A260004 [uncultured Desulfobacterium sp.]|uniref:Uncharacterized protein n=1 Tax=uncultured Desulfobacterium sp. TaxID=201089 RepID=A0A445MZ02_9BACT|nr:hypothetical protein PITCH_A260004 [uncultured Desulfobacterium sp.]
MEQTYFPTLEVNNVPFQPITYRRYSLISCCLSSVIRIILKFEPRRREGR